MKVTELELKGLKQIELKIFGDMRGFFTERFNESKYKESGLPVKFAQDNHSRSAPGVLRGLHYQSVPAQGKLVGVVRGRIWDVAVDIRRGSPTFGKHVGLELSDENGKMLWIPAGFAHGFCVLGSDPADLLYKVDALYNPASEGGILWSDPALGIRWPLASPVLSARDVNLPSFADFSKANPF
jgi:dTDP-4-dehydrorhamnose 3,5-epimerase